MITTFTMAMVGDACPVVSVVAPVVAVVGRSGSYLTINSTSMTHHTVTQSFGG
jgi:hypothetical protein